MVRLDVSCARDARKGCRHKKKRALGKLERNTTKDLDETYNINCFNDTCMRAVREENTFKRKYSGNIDKIKIQTFLMTKKINEY